MRKKPEYSLVCGTLAACGGDARMEVWGRNPLKLFPLKDTPLLAAGFFNIDFYPNFVLYF
jgi:hypothetical protein